jgi:hypothetical protein
MAGGRQPLSLVVFPKPGLSIGCGMFPQPMYILAWLILFVAVLLWACYYYRYGYLELKRKAEEAEREAKQEDNILSGTPIEPKHANPKLKRWGWGIPNSLRRFFADFDRFGVIANGWAPVKDSPWRLQELKDTRLRTFNNDCAEHGRRYDLFYNQQRVGSLEIGVTPDYTTEEPRVRANVVIRDARLIPFDDISRFLTGIATLFSAGTGDEYAEAKRNLEIALPQAYLAKRGKGMDAAPEVVVEVSFLGSAATYIKLRARQGKEHRAA